MALQAITARSSQRFWKLITQAIGLLFCRGIAWAAPLGLLLLSPTVHADTVFSNISATGCGCGTFVAGIKYSSESLATAFTPNGNYSLTGAEARLDGINLGGTVDFALYSDSSNVPGYMLTALGSVTLSGSAEGVFTVSDVSKPVALSSGTQYWLVLMPDTVPTNIYWEAGGPSNQPFATSIDVTGGSAWVTAGTGSFQFQINGTPAQATVPEPATTWLLFAGMGWIALGRVRHSFFRRLYASPGFSRMRRAAGQRGIGLFRRVGTSAVYVTSFMVVWGCTTAQQASADTLTFSAPFGTQFGFGADPVFPPFSQQVQLMGFDPSLGTLTGIQLSFSNLIFASNVLVTGATFAPTTVSYTNVGMTQALTLSAPDGTLLTHTYALGPADGSLAFTSAQDFLESPVLSASNTDSGGAVPGADFSLFERSQELTFTAAADVAVVTGSLNFGTWTDPYGFALPAGGGNVMLTGDLVGGNATITYTYRPNIVATPEPQPAYLFVAWAGLIALRRMRNSFVTHI